MSAQFGHPLNRKQPTYDLQEERYYVDLGGLPVSKSWTGWL